VGLSAKERARLVELELVKARRQTLRAAAERLDLSRRQIRRIWRRFRSKGVKGLAHASRGRPSNRATEIETRGRVLEICRGGLEGFGPTLAAEKLAEVGLKIDHETLRRWLIFEGIWRKKKKRGPHRKWRPPKEHFGELVQMDGSFHDWLETGQKPCLLDMVDDATARMGGEFFEQETTEGAMRVLWQWIGAVRHPAGAVHRPQECLRGRSRADGGGAARRPPCADGVRQGVPQPGDPDHSRG